MKRREIVTTLVESIGAGMFVAGVSQIYVPAGFIACGLWLVGISWLAAR